MLEVGRVWWHLAALLGVGGADAAVRPILLASISSAVVVRWTVGGAGLKRPVGGSAADVSSTKRPVPLNEPPASFRRCVSAADVRRFRVASLVGWWPAFSGRDAEDPKNPEHPAGCYSRHSIRTQRLSVSTKSSSSSAFRIFHLMSSRWFCDHQKGDQLRQNRDEIDRSIQQIHKKNKKNADPAENP